MIRSGSGAQHGSICATQFCSSRNFERIEPQVGDKLFGPLSHDGISGPLIAFRGRVVSSSCHESSYRQTSTSAHADRATMLCVTAAFRPSSQRRSGGLQNFLGGGGGRGKKKGKQKNKITKFFKFFSRHDAARASWPWQSIAWPGACAKETCVARTV